MNAAEDGPSDAERKARFAALSAPKTQKLWEMALRR